jgi:Glyoxalase-like domain
MERRSCHHTAERRVHAVTIPVQVTFDCADPHAMARFWAAALSYEKEDHSELVESLLQAAALQPDDTVVVDGGRQFADVSACRDPAGSGPRIFFQRVPEPKTSKNRVHLDLHVGQERYQGEADRLERLGARRLWYSDDRGGECWTMADVEGNEFCVD